MPLVRITTRDSRDDAALCALGDAVHGALVEAFQIPADDRFQIHDRFAPARFVADPHYLGIERRDPVIVEVTLRATRTPAMKRAFYRRLVELAAPAGVRPEDVMVVMHENNGADWSFGLGEAQYAATSPAGT